MPKFRGLLGRLHGRPVEASAAEPAVANGTMMADAPTSEQRPDLYSTEGSIGMRVVADPLSASLDIIFIHGLTGNRDTTWTHNNGLFWPLQLAEDIRSARVMTFGYDADVVKLWGMAGSNNLRNHGKNLAFAVSDRRRDCRERPIVFIAHSLGGLVCEQSLLYCGEGEKNLEKVFQSTRGIIFMGTPHAGALTNWGYTLATYLNVVRRTNFAILDPLRQESDALTAVQQQFQQLLHKPGVSIEIYCFFEEKAVVGVGVIVPEHSATLSQYPNQSIAANHMDMARFSGRTDEGYQRVLSRVQDNIDLIESSNTTLEDVRKHSGHEKRIEYRWVAQTMTSQSLMNETNDRDTPKAHREPEEVLKAIQMSVFACVKSFYFHKLDDRQHNIRESLPETCNWLFENPTYHRWYDRQSLEKHHGLLWIKGKPGSGKSTLMKEAYRRAQQCNPAVLTTVVAFFFNARGSDLEKSSLGLFKSILYQILERDRQLLAKMVQEFKGQITIGRNVREWCLDVFKSFPLLGELTQKFVEKENAPGKSGRWEWHLDEVQSFFKRAFTKPNGYRTVIFIDALDECCEEDMRDMVDFFIDVTDSAYAIGSDLDICLASRHYPSITVSPSQKIIVENNNRTDIALYVQVKLYPAILENNTVSFLKNSIIQKSDGVFLWVELVVKMLIGMIRDGRTRREIKDVLQSVPKTLENLFSDLLDTLAQNERFEALRLIQWVLLAKRPLNLGELCLVTAFISEGYTSLQEWKNSDNYVPSYQQMVRRVRSYSKGLIEVTNSVVQFIHESVREWFLQGNGFAVLNNSPVPCAIGEGHLSIVRACMNLISTEELRHFDSSGRAADRKLLSSFESLGWMDSSEEDDNFYGLSIFEYAVDHLFHHCREVEDNGTVAHQIVDWFNDSGAYLWGRWKALKRANTGNGVNFAKDVSLLYIICVEDIVSCAIYLLELGEDPNGAGVSAKYPIIAATERSKNSTKIVQALLQHKADVCVKDNSGWTALHMAAKHNNEEVVRLLVEQGADVNAKTYNGGVAIYIAIENESVAIIRLLEEYNAKIDIEDRYVQKVLLRAVRSGSGTQVQLLLGRQDKVYVKDPDSQITLRFQSQMEYEEGMTALCWAACRGEDTLLRLMLRHKFDVHTALHQAAEWGQESAVKILLQHAGDVDVKDRKGMTALHWAIIRGDVLVARPILESMIDMEAQTRDREMAMHILAEGWSDEIAQLLLKHKANINEKDMEGRTILHLMATKGHKGAVRMLLEHNADLNARDVSGRTALHLATKQRDEEIARLLLEHGADVNAREIYGQTALHRAANGDVAVVQLLLQHDICVDEKNNEGKTALHIAAGWGCEEVVRLLLKHDANIHTRDNYGLTPLGEAIKWKQEEVVRFLKESDGTSVESGVP